MNEINKFTLRLPESVNRQLQKEAQRQRRSKTQQVIAILEERYAPKQSQQPAAQAA